MPNRTDLVHRGLKLCATVAFVGMLPQPSLGAGLPVPGLPSLPIGGLPGGGGGPGPGGGGPGGGGLPGSSGPGNAGFAGGSGTVVSGTGFGFQDDGSGIPGTTGPDAKWGDPLSTDILGNANVHARLKYFGESGAQGTTQAVGIKFSWQ